MIDHVSIAVSHLQRATRFYEQVLAPLGLAKLVERAGTAGFGKRYPEFWVNLRPGHVGEPAGSGAHVCLRARDVDAVDGFFAVATEHGGEPDGPPGMRPDYTDTYYAAFIRDPDGNRIEAVTFVEPA